MLRCVPGGLTAIDSDFATGIGHPQIRRDIVVGDYTISRLSSQLVYM
jgi:hypothetical protein